MDIAQADQLYDRYVAPVERDHMGEFVAVATDGRMVFAPTLLDALDHAAALGPDNMTFRVGERAVGKWL